MSKKNLSVFVFFLFLTLGVHSQDKQGNIVQYFGKEKVDDINEGKLYHVFTEGLIVGQNRFYLNSNTAPKNPVISNYLLNPEYKIEEGAKAYPEDTENKWETITVDEESQFSDRKLRGGYLYVEYESPQEKIVILEASGSTQLFINGMPHEGDHYDFGYSLIPVKLKKGLNNILFTGGRFPRVRARLIEPNKDVQLTTRDMTLPDVLADEQFNLWGAIRIVNSEEGWFKGGKVHCETPGGKMETALPDVAPMITRKINFEIPWFKSGDKTQEITVSLKDRNGKILSSRKINIGVRSKGKHHKRTFISAIDGSVQYYSVAPPTTDTLSNPAMFLSVHGASVEAVNQANAYKKKDWGYLVAATNRRPYGFAWEDWGRMDAMEVLNDAEELFKTDPSRTYLTGHSMGGHGTWYLGATYPDRFAAIGPAAGYPDLLGYRDSFRRRLKNMTDEELQAWGMTRERANEMMRVDKYKDQLNIAMDSIIRRAGSPSRTLKLKRNYLHYGVYVLHGEKDTVVPTFIAREMRSILGTYHNDFTYYEYPNGTHWYGNHSVDWSPLFDFFKFREIKPSEEIEELEFYTGSPGVSSGSHYIEIIQQEVPFGISSFNLEREKNNSLTTKNIEVLKIDLNEMGSPDTVIVDNRVFSVSELDELVLEKESGEWEKSMLPSMAEKGPHRNGGFKDAFTNNFIIVYATKGSKEEREWYYNRARLDAEKFYYRANGNVEIMPDKDYDSEQYKDRNVILYGNSDNNRVWDDLLKECPVQVSDNQIKMGSKILTGENLGAYFIYRKSDSNKASIGVVTATGMRGAKAAYANHYLVNGTTFPDIMVFDDAVIKYGIPGVKAAGFFGNDWSVENGDFVWRD